MRNVASNFACIVSLLLILAGCGDSVPSSSPVPMPGSATTTAAVATQPAPQAYVVSNSAFVRVPAVVLEQAARMVFDCNLDAVDGHAAGSLPLSHEGSATFTGWAADTATGAVPEKLRLVLTGTHDYAVAVGTGLDRMDVAQALHAPAFSTSGYAVDADLSAVAVGHYGVTLLYSVAGQSLSCVTKVRIDVQ